MAHYAILNENNLVTQVIVGKDENELDANGNFIDWEQYYGGKRTSYNTYANEHLGGGTPFRYNFAGIGYKFEPNVGEHGAFVPPHINPSWTLNTTKYIYEPPTPYPTDGKPYYWSEPSQQWIELPTE
jgi:hypothetical protein